MEGEQWERIADKRRIILHSCFHSIKHFRLCLSFSVLVLDHSLFYLTRSYTKSISLNSHPYSVSAVLNLIAKSLQVEKHQRFDGTFNIN